jgi:hypothetical protein
MIDSARVKNPWILPDWQLLLASLVSSEVKVSIILLWVGADHMVRVSVDLVLLDLRVNRLETTSFVVRIVVYLVMALRPALRRREVTHRPFLRPPRLLLLE